MKILSAILLMLIPGLVLIPSAAGASSAVQPLRKEPGVIVFGIDRYFSSEHFLAQAGTERPRRVAPARRARPDPNQRIQPRPGTRPEVVRPGGRPAGIGRPQGAPRPRPNPRPRGR
ncbi:MAG TPA: hypothetical protein VLH61_02300 [Bacteroidales bacterium]|nr:hypothetical protein [Bacteroidales bacterium]